MTKIIDRAVPKLPVPAKGNRVYYDGEDGESGFGVRVTRGGHRAFVLNYRIHGRERRLTIGQWPTWSATAARAEARELKRRIDRGEDPLRQRQEERDAPTVSELVEVFTAEHLPKKRPSSQASYRSILDREIPKSWLRRKVADITTDDIERLHRDITQRGVGMRANRAVAVLSKMFSHARRKGWIADNPCKGIERNRETKRRRYLRGNELVRLTETLRGWRDQRAANAVRWCMLTGCRKGEAVTARWRDIDFERGVWVKPAETTKTGEIHEVPLSPPALQLLAELGGGRPDALLFPARDGGPQRHLSNVWADIAEKAQLEDCRLHDLRHSYASFLVSRGASLPLIGALLGHSTPTTTARYAHLFDDAQRAATDAVGDFIASAASSVVDEVKLLRLGRAK